MNIRKIKRRSAARIRANHEEVFRTFSIGTGEYAGTWRVWRVFPYATAPQSGVAAVVA
jgi:hypothetical protein